MKLFFVFHLILIKLGEVVVTHVYVLQFHRVSSILDEKQNSFINSPFFCSEFQSVSRFVKIIHSGYGYGIWLAPKRRIFIFRFFSVFRFSAKNGGRKTKNRFQRFLRQFLVEFNHCCLLKVEFYSSKLQIVLKFAQKSHYCNNEISMQISTQFRLVCDILLV